MFKSRRSPTGRQEGKKNEVTRPIHLSGGTLYYPLSECISTNTLDEKNAVKISYKTPECVQPKKRFSKILKHAKTGLVVALGVVVLAVAWQGGYRIGREDMYDQRLEDLRSAKLRSLQEKISVANEIETDLKISNNIDFTLRYSPGIIEDMLSARDTARKLAFVFYPKSDWNNSFMFNKLENIHLAGYQVVVVESESVGHFREQVCQLAKKWGKAPLVLIGGHGTQNSISFNSAQTTPDSTAGYLGMSDPVPFKELKSLLADSAKIILESCSTAEGAKNMASMISKLTGATVYAPDMPSSIDGFSFADFSFIDVQYRGASTKVYFDGKLVSQHR